VFGRRPSRWALAHILVIIIFLSFFIFYFIMIRPHRSITYVDAAFCYRPSSVVCRSVCHTNEPCKKGCTEQDTVWVEDLGESKEPCIRWGSRSPMGRGNFEGKRASHCKL